MNLDIRDPEEMEYINMCLKKVPEQSRGEQ